MESIDLVYYNDLPNFGDALSPYVVSEISGCRINPCSSTSLKDCVIRLIKNLLRLNFTGTKNNYRILLNNIFQKHLSKNRLLAIGSILGDGNDNSVIWGSGFMNETEEFHGGKICAVRGWFSAQKLARDGFESCKVCGDPALLLPLLYQPVTSLSNYIGIIPHWSETNEFISAYGNQYKVIDLRLTDIFRVIDEISSCKIVLSTSLHGIIVAHAYGIPALWIKAGYISTDGFKFYDYFSSVNISIYKGFENYKEILSSSDRVESFFKDNMPIALPNVNLGEIQYGLLRVFPYPLLNKFESMIR